MNENLIGYLLKALDDETHLAVERHVRTEPDALRHLELLRRALAPLDADAAPPEPPPGLRIRTLGLLAEQACRKTAPVEPAPPPPRTIPMPRRWWRRADVLASAAVILVSFSLIPSAVVNVNRYRDRLYCQNNLRVLHGALMGYADLHDHHLPKVEAEPPGNFAGVFLPVLQSSGLINGEVPVQCAANKQPAPRRLSMDEVRQMTQEELKQYHQDARDLYAYTLGYHDPGGKVLNGLRRGPDTDLLPVLADNPPFVQPLAGTRLPGNSRNHGGTGQNVLRLGGNVDFTTTRHVSGSDRDDIYLNDNGHVAAGLHPKDTVLGASLARPVPVLPVSD
jgi:hypothetical protein